MPAVTEPTNTSSEAESSSNRPTGAELRRLKGMAQRLDTVTRLGHGGLSPTFIAAVNHELANHELVKIKFTDFKDQKKELAAKLAEATNSHLIWIIGHVAVLYRKAAKPAAATE